MNYSTEIKLTNFKDSTQIKIYDSDNNYFCFSGDYDDRLYQMGFSVNQKYKLKDIEKIEIIKCPDKQNNNKDYYMYNIKCKTLASAIVILALPSDVVEMVKKINLNENIINNVLDYVGLHDINILKYSPMHSISGTNSMYRHTQTVLEFKKDVVYKKSYLGTKEEKWILNAVHVEHDGNYGNYDVMDIDSRIYQFNSYNDCLNCFNKLVNANNVDGMNQGIFSTKVHSEQSSKSCGALSEETEESLEFKGFYNFNYFATIQMIKIKN